jgi:hypothetical protein
MLMALIGAIAAMGITIAMRAWRVRRAAAQANRMASVKVA